MCSPGDSAGPAHQLALPGVGPASDRAGRRRCGAIRADGLPCRAWAVRGSEPARCAMHTHRSPSVSGQRLTHRSPAVSDQHSGDRRDLTQIKNVVADLAERQQQLTAYLGRCLEAGVDVEEMARLFALHGQNASRLGRLLKDQQALSEESADVLFDVIGQALDEISEELGIEL